MAITERPTQKPSILAAGVSLALRNGLFKFSRADVASNCEVGESTVSYHFKTMANLRKCIVQYAVEHEVVSILADALTSRETIGVKISDKLCQKAANYIGR